MSRHLYKSPDKTLKIIIQTTTKHNVTVVEIIDITTESTTTRMGDIVMLFFIQNIFVFSLIFWALTVIGGYFYKKKNHYMKKQFYECGFKAISDINIQINLNFTMLCVFLILYDIEFTLLFPVLFSYANIIFFQFTVYVIFIFLILLSLYYDIQVNALNWQY